MLLFEFVQLSDLIVEVIDHLQEVGIGGQGFDLIFRDELESCVFVRQSWIATACQLRQPVNDDLWLSLHAVIQCFGQILMNFQIASIVTGFFLCFPQCCCVIVFTWIDMT